MTVKSLVITLATIVIVISACAAGTRFQQKQSVIEVPFDFVRNQIIVHGSINGRGPFNLLLDTDTDPSGIDLALARQLGLQIDSIGHRATGGGTDANQVYATKLPSVEVGGLTAKNVAAGAINLGKLGERLGIPLHGVLGYSFLKNRIVQIDYPAHKLRFFAVSPFPVHSRTEPNIIPFHYDDGVHIDDVSINGVKVRATLDTGSSSAFVLTPAAVALLNLQEEAANGQATTSVGYNGEHETRVGKLKTVRLGAITVESVGAYFWLPGTGHDTHKFQVNIGNDFFKDYVVTFDFRSKVVVLSH